jgi:exodeoxyribonuclease VII large subunit
MRIVSGQIGKHGPTFPKLAQRETDSTQLPQSTLLFVTPHDPFAPQLDLTFDDTRQSRRIWPVRELVSQVRELVEEQYGDVWVEGEISNYRPAPSGHLYFTLKDADAQLPIVLFRRQAMLLRFRPEDGLHVLVRGRVSVYEQRGQLQLVAETMQPVGAGSLQLAFEQLKERLKAEGLFDADRKRPLPSFPRTVGIITSPTGSVIRDFLNIVGRRHSGLSVLLVPVSVQGDQAPAEIEAAIELLNDALLNNAAFHGTPPGGTLVDLIVLARGGGSLEDLAAFNSERVARAIVSSKLPVVSAIGHETDFTIADFVADLRAPTPSAAAELITEAQHKIAEHLATHDQRLQRAARFQLLQARQRLMRLPVSRAETRVSTLLHRSAQRVDDLSQRLDAALDHTLRLRQSHVAELSATVLRHDPRQALAHARERLLACRIHLDRSAERRIHTAAAALNSLDARLHSLSPLSVLDRGYALVLNAKGALVRSSAQLAPGNLLTTRLADGSFTSRVEATARANSSARSPTSSANPRKKK